MTHDQFMAHLFPELGPEHRSADEIMHSFVEQIALLIKSQWYWGAICSLEAEELLANEPVGTFLVRDSRNGNYVFSLSLVTREKIIHSRLEKYNGHYCLGGPYAIVKSPCLVTFIEEAMKCSLGGNHCILMHSSTHGNSDTVMLTNPLKRVNQMPSLQYFCRLAIREHLKDGNKLKKLPLPEALIKYVATKKYLLMK
uniref:Suppressor of cytokine signaling 2 n=1 Tax=Rhabditophanes sp. KR3021 TaxID=114890 RepID=A0AC35TVA5_9BILA